MTIEHIEIAAEKFGINQTIVKAIVQVESGGDIYAVRYEPDWKWFFRVSYWASKLRITDKTERLLQMCSFGPMQVIGANARENGHTGSLIELCSWEIGLLYGCKYLKKQLVRYLDYQDAIAAYNAGSVRLNLDGTYKNQDYVDKVMKAYASIKKEVNSWECLTDTHYGL